MRPFTPSPFIAPSSPGYSAWSVFSCPALLGLWRGRLARNASSPLRELLWASILICAFSLLAGLVPLWHVHAWALSPFALAVFAGAGPAGYLLLNGGSSQRRQSA